MSSGSTDTFEVSEEIPETHAPEHQVDLLECCELEDPQQSEVAEAEPVDNNYPIFSEGFCSMSSGPSDLFKSPDGRAHAQASNDQKDVSHGEWQEEPQESKVVEHAPEFNSLPEACEEWCSLIKDWPMFLEYLGPKWCGYLAPDKLERILSWSHPGTVIISALTNDLRGGICSITFKPNYGHSVTFQILKVTRVYRTNWKCMSRENWSLSVLLELTIDDIRTFMGTETLVIQPEVIPPADRTTALVRELAVLRNVLQENQLWWGSFLLEKHWYEKDEDKRMTLNIFLVSQKVQEGTTPGLIVHFSYFKSPGYLFHVLLANKLSVKVFFKKSGFLVMRGDLEKHVQDTHDLLDYIAKEQRVTLVPKDLKTLTTVHTLNHSFAE